MKSNPSTCSTWVAVLLAGSVGPAFGQTNAAGPAKPPVVAKNSRYCNPLPMPIGPGANASGDVTVIREKDKYYMYCTGGGAWVSDDLVNWAVQPVVFNGQGSIP